VFLDNLENRVVPSRNLGHNPTPRILVAFSGAQFLPDLVKYLDRVLSAQKIGFEIFIRVLLTLWPLKVPFSYHPDLSHKSQLLWELSKPYNSTASIRRPPLHPAQSKRYGSIDGA
jgi:hypothetical protein